jgi:hypothetical protein
MAPAIAFQSIAIAAQSIDDEGRLVLVDDRLAAVLVLLRDDVHGEHRGCWFLEAAFGDFAGGAHTLFESLDAAARWFSAERADPLQPMNSPGGEPPSRSSRDIGAAAPVARQAR